MFHARNRHSAESPGVIFDVDGVLIDSYEAHFSSWRRLAEETGAAFSRHDFSRTFGRTSRDILREFWPGTINEQALQALDDRKEALYRDIIAADFSLMPGAVELIDALRDQGFVLGVGSSGPPENVELVLDRIGRKSAFKAAVTGRDVSRGKPAPDVFLLAARRMDVPPSRALVIEDAPAGIAAARAAGMKSVALLSTGRARADFASVKPDAIIGSLSELSPQRLRLLLGQPANAE